MELNKVYLGDCMQVMKEFPDNSVDSICCDPPYELGFMGKSWDNTGIANNPEMWAECLRVLKPGGHLLAFSGTRTYHRMACAIEDAGFEVRDMIEWVYGCLSEDTEILTANGWKMLYSIFEGDYVFACDYINDMKLQLEPVKQKFIYDYDEDAYHIKDTGYYNSELMETDHIVSKNHNVLVSESWAMDCFSNGEYPQKVAAEVLYKNVQKRKELGYKSDFHIPGLNGFIPCTIEKIPYKGKVWCVEVESGAFVARRNGKIFITGNSGFPKSLNIGKAVDKLQGNNREVIGIQTNIANKSNDNTGRYNWNTKNQIRNESIDITKGTSEYEGWGTALKPSHEPICMAQKPKDDKFILDACCGGKMFWFDKNHPNTLYIDKRTCEKGHNKTKPNHEVKPDMLMDFTDLQFADKTFNMVVFDPPHLFLGENSKFAKDYGTLKNTNWEEDIKKGFLECFRVLKDYGVLIFKWNEFDIPVDKILSLTDVKPLFGQRSGKQGKTHWISFMKIPEGQQQDTTPAHEPICMARKPLAEKTVAENCLKWGTGGINIDISRVDTITEADKNNFHQNRKVVKEYKADETLYELGMKTVSTAENSLGRFPANLLHDNSEEVRECFPETGKSTGGRIGNKGSALNMMGQDYEAGDPGYGDSGNASRFFKSIENDPLQEWAENEVAEHRDEILEDIKKEYGIIKGKSIIYQAKASKSERNKGCEELEEKIQNNETTQSRTFNDRCLTCKKKFVGSDNTICHCPPELKITDKTIYTNKNNHPTVKPIALMEYLIKMVTPKGGVVLDPFAGSGSTLVAAKQNGYQYIGIEMTDEYIPIIEARLLDKQNQLL